MQGPLRCATGDCNTRGKVPKGVRSSPRGLLEILEGRILWLGKNALGHCPLIQLPQRLQNLFPQQFSFPMPIMEPLPTDDPGIRLCLQSQPASL